MHIVGTYFTIPRFLFFLLTSSSRASRSELAPCFRFCARFKYSSWSSSWFPSSSSSSSDCPRCGDARGDVRGEIGAVARRIKFGLGHRSCEPGRCRGGRGEVGSGARRTRWERRGWDGILLSTKLSHDCRDWCMWHYHWHVTSFVCDVLDAWSLKFLFSFISA